MAANDLDTTRPPATDRDAAPDLATTADQGPPPRRPAPRASLLDTLWMTVTPVVPFFARGPFMRRRRVTGLIERFDLDARAVRNLQRLRDRYDGGPVRLRLPGRAFTFLLEPEQVHRALEESPEPFSLATLEKRLGLGHFQPDGVLISRPPQRAHRKPFNEAVLEAGSPLHHLAGTMTDAVREEAAVLLAQAERSGEVDWDAFAVAWWRIVRRVVLGDSARDDTQVTDDLLRLRREANRVYLTPLGRERRRRRFLGRLEHYVERAEPGSLASLVASTPDGSLSERTQQIPQWLFANDGALQATFRAFTLLATHPDVLARARGELGGSPDLPYLRACVLESLRLWPALPVILRDTTAPTDWPTGTLPAGTPLVIFSAFFHRDETRLAQAHRCVPEIWLRERTGRDWPLVPFSGGPGMCPGRNVVLLVASTLLAALVEHHDWRQSGGGVLDPDAPLPGSLSPFRLRVSLQGARQSGSSGPSQGTGSAPSA